MTKTNQPRRRGVRQIGLFVIAVVALWLVSGRSARAQATERLAFDVASVKPNAINDQRQAMLSMSLQYLPGGRFAARSVPVPVLVFEAYSVNPGPSNRITLSPDFQKSMDPGLESQTYDIDAVAAQGAIPVNASPSVQRERIRLMLQTLLAERFKLRIHRETKEVPAYAMVVGKNGLKLQKSVMDETRCTVTSTDKPQFVRLFAAPDSTACHSFSGGPRPGMRGDAVDMSDLAVVVERFSDRPVVDQTGLSGLYKVVIPAWQLPSGEGTGDKSLGLEPASETISDVIQTLGLRLESTKAAVELFVVEHFERPAQE